MTFIIRPGLNGSDDHHHKMKRNAVTSFRRLWPGAVIPYEIASIFDSKLIDQN